jgi:HAD superfamily hydrolase (TIGR01509 family)
MPGGNRKGSARASIRLEYESSPLCTESMCKAFIFDVDGTLIDSVDAHAHSWVETLAEFGHRVDFAAMRHEIGKGGDQLMRTFLSDEEIELRGEAIEKARKERFRAHYLDKIRGFPKTRELFQRILSEGKKIVLASSAAGEELRIFKEKARIADLIEEETSRDDAEKSKPHPDIFEEALKKLPGIEPREAIVVGDTPWDAIASRRAGLRIIGVLCGGFPEEELRRNGCMAIYRDPADLLERYDFGECP